MRLKTRAQMASRRLIRELVKPLLARASEDDLIKVINILWRYSPVPKHREDFGKLVGLLKNYPSAGELTPHARRRLVETLVINPIVSAPLRKERESMGMAAPFLWAISPTNRCGLKSCVGCYDRGDFIGGEITELPFETADGAVKEFQRDLGVYNFTITGGEPREWGGSFNPAENWLLRLARGNPESSIQFYTHGVETRTDSSGDLVIEPMSPAYVAEIAKLGNLFPAISLEGGPETTNRRRGGGVRDVYGPATESMARLHQAGAVFFVSLTVFRQNLYEITSDEMIKEAIRLGAIIAWFFPWVPVAETEVEKVRKLQLTPRERRWLAHRIVEIRQTFPIFAADFWDDGSLVMDANKGNVMCMAAGRLYGHLNCRGDWEFCVFGHHATDNIHNGIGPAQAVDSDFFRLFRSKHPWSCTPGDPCPMIDHNEVIREIIQESGAKPTRPLATCVLQGPVADYLKDEYGPQYVELCRQEYGVGQ